MINAWLHVFENNKNLNLTKEVLNQPIFFEPQTKLNFDSNNPKSLYIVTSNTITDKCILIRDRCKLFQQGFFLSTRFPLPTLTELIFILHRYLIPNDWKQRL